MSDTPSGVTNLVPDDAEDTFDPAKHLTKVGQADYMEVKWRLVWLRDQHPDAAITTDLVHHDPERQFAVFRALVTIPGGGSATGWGTEDQSDFRDYVEKAETKAVGRALAALGFGTQFVPDFEFGATEGRVVDSPVARPGTASRAPSTGAPRNGSRGPLTGAGTEKQVKFLQAILREQCGVSAEGVDTLWSVVVGPDGIVTVPKATLSDAIEAAQRGEVLPVVRGWIESRTGPATADPDPPTLDLALPVNRQKVQWKSWIVDPQIDWITLTALAEQAVKQGGEKQAWRLTGLALYAPDTDTLAAVHDLATDLGMHEVPDFLAAVNARYAQLQPAAPA